MNFVLSVTDSESQELLTELHERLGLPLTVVLHGRGTAVKSMRELLGIETKEKRITLTVADREKTARLMALERRYLHIGVPGHGLTVAVPVKSVGGGKAVAFLKGDNQSAGYVPELDYRYELLVAIANEGTTDLVMNAARSAGARGGTVIHGKGTAAGDVARFYNLSLASEKEVILIVAPSEEKKTIMSAVLQKAGPDSPAGTLIFSLPVSAVDGFGFLRDAATEL